MYSSSGYTVSRRQASCIQAIPPYGTRPKVVKLLARVHTTHSVLHCVLCTHTSSTRSRSDDYWMDFCFPARLVHRKKVENWKKIPYTGYVYTIQTVHCVVCTHTSCTRSRFDDFWIEFCFSVRLVRGKRVENLKTISHAECVYTVPTVHCVVCTHTSSTRSRFDDFWIEFCFPVGLMHGNKSKI